MADLKYGVNGSHTTEGNHVSDPGAGVHTHTQILEIYDPTATTAKFYWIPKGLFWDLMDDTPYEVIGTWQGNPDQVKGSNNAQFYNSLQSDVKSVQSFRDKFISIYGTGQQNQIRALLQVYGY